MHKKSANHNLIGTKWIDINFAEKNRRSALVIVAYVGHKLPGNSADKQQAIIRKIN
jgi:hypothetical protein